MTRGKRTCKILKEIRRQIAEKNDIAYVTSECGFQGECKGTCPKCEEEVRYLENELHKRQQLGKVVAIAGISLGVAGSFAACNNAVQQSENTTIEQVFPETQKVTIANFTDTTNTDTIITKSNVVRKRTPIISTQIDNYYEQIMGFPCRKAEFPGGGTALAYFLNTVLEYPQTAIDNSITGIVIAEFTIDTTGKVVNPKIIKKVHSTLDMATLAAIKKMPRWKPAGCVDEGKQISHFQLPVQFKLQEASKRGKCQFPGGREACMDFIDCIRVYPQEAIDDGIEGTVIIKFIVDTTGKVQNPKVTVGMHPALNKEALTVIEKMPLWIPDTTDTEIHLPITFVLPEENK